MDQINWCQKKKKSQTNNQLKKHLSASIDKMETNQVNLYVLSTDS